MTKEVFRWIPVTERLPKSSDTYLVTLDLGVHGRGIIITYYDTLKGWNTRFETSIIAWMQTPQPYKYREAGGDIDVLLDYFKQDKQ